jgi:hypothetical protein
MGSTASDGWNNAFPDMGVLTKYDQNDPVYLPYSAVTFIYLHPVISSPYNVKIF